MEETLRFQNYSTRPNLRLLTLHTRTFQPLPHIIYIFHTQTYQLLIYNQLENVIQIINSRDGFSGLKIVTFLDMEIKNIFCVISGINWEHWIPDFHQNMTNLRTQKVNLKL